MSKFKFNPDKMVDSGTFTNGQRAERGEKAVRLSPASTHFLAKDTTPRDIISDVLHFCDKHGFEARDEIEAAVMNWEAER